MEDKPREWLSQPDIICPYCNYIHPDSWEYQEDEEDFTCDDCGEHFTMIVEHSTTYSTQPKARPIGEVEEPEWVEYVYRGGSISTASGSGRYFCEVRRAYEEQSKQKMKQLVNQANTAKAEHERAKKLADLLDDAPKPPDILTLKPIIDKLPTEEGIMIMESIVRWGNWYAKRGEATNE